MITRITKLIAFNPRSTELKLFAFNPHSTEFVITRITKLICNYIHVFDHWITQMSCILLESVERNLISMLRAIGYFHFPPPSLHVVQQIATKQLEMRLQVWWQKLFLEQALDMHQSLDLEMISAKEQISMVLPYTCIGVAHCYLDNVVTLATTLRPQYSILLYTQLPLSTSKRRQLCIFPSHRRACDHDVVVFSVQVI